MLDCTAFIYTEVLKDALLFLVSYADIDIKFYVCRICQPTPFTGSLGAFVYPKLTMDTITKDLKNLE